MMDEYKNSLKNIGLQFFAGEGGTDSEGDPGSGSEGTGSEGTGTGTGHDPGGKTFTQDDVNSMMKREREAATKKLLKELGLEDTKSGKEALAKYKELLEKDQSEAEKAKGALSTAEKAKLEAEARATLAEAKVEVLSAGCKPDYLDDVIALAMGRVTDDKDIKTVVADMKKDSKYAVFFGGEESSPGTGGGSGYRRQGKDTDPGALGKRLGAPSTPKKNSYFS